MRLACKADLGLAMVEERGWRKGGGGEMDSSGLGCSRMESLKNEFLIFSFLEGGVPGL